MTEQAPENVTPVTPDPQDSGMETDSDVGEFEAPPHRVQWRAMLPAALFGTATLLVLTFLVMPWLATVEAVPDVVKIAVTPVFHTLIAGYAIWVLWRHQQKLFERRVRLLDVLLEGAIAFAVWITVMFVNFSIGCLWTLVGGDSPELPDEFQEIIFSQNVAFLMFVAVLACLWAPVSEELFFRRMLLRSLQGRLHLGVALLLQAALFTVLHNYYQGIQFAPLFVLGLALGGLYVWRKTILSSMMLHAIQNTFATTMLGILMWASARAPVLGVELENAEPGARVVSVVPNSAAETAGLREGDVITMIGPGGWMGRLGMMPQPVPDASTLRILLMLHSPDDEVQLSVKRDDESLRIRVTLEKRDESAPDEDPGDEQP